MVNELLLSEAIARARKGDPKEAIASACGIKVCEEALRRIQAEPAISLTPQQFYAKQSAEKRAFFRDRPPEAERPHQVSKADHCAIVASILKSVQAGERPCVLSLLKEYGTKNNRAEDWAIKVRTHHHSKRMTATLKEHKDNPVLQDLRSGGMLSQTHKGALIGSTYSGFSELLFASSQLVRRNKHLEQQLTERQDELRQLQVETARLQSTENWKDEAFKLYSSTKQSIRCIAEKVGKSKSTVDDYIQTCIKTGSLLRRSSTVSI
jgi:ribosomal protein S19E (S16A)